MVTHSAMYICQSALSDSKAQVPSTSIPQDFHDQTERKIFIKMKMIRLFVAISIVLLLASQINAEEEAETKIELDEVVTVGTRLPERSVLDSPVPVDVINADEIRKTGHTEVGRILQTLAPSFNFSSSSISDGTDALRPATDNGQTQAQ